MGLGKGGQYRSKSLGNYIINFFSHFVLEYSLS